MSELLGANTDVLDRVAQSLSTDARRVQDIRTLAQRAVAELQAGWSGPDLLHLTQQWEQQASPQLGGASASLDTCAARLQAQSAAQRGASGADGGGAGLFPTAMAAGAALGTLPPGPTGNPTGDPTGNPSGNPSGDPSGDPLTSPPRNGSPAGNATWWRSLSPEQQQQVVSQHPDWIGNRDGVSFTARDQANRALLTVDRHRLEVERQRLEADLADNWFGGAFTNDDAALDQVRDKLASLDAIEQTLARPGERQLLLLDLGPERAEAAIARGNVETAQNVAVLIPGLASNVTESMRGYDTKMDHLQHRAELESKRANPTQQAATATVTWIGYQAPQLGWDLLNPDTSVAGDTLARKGAVQLTPFLQGIGARDPDPHLTVLGYSYGSTTAGLALQQNTGVDDAVFFGSPGLGTNHVEDLKLADGHAYYIEARWDGVGDLGAFGIDPSHMDGIEHASARESTVVDPVTGETRHFREVMGHLSYLDDDSTSQYNMAVVVAGVPDRRVHDEGEGVGDVLSWPVPGTYR